jgi:hypothetical protein
MRSNSIEIDGKHYGIDAELTIERNSPMFDRNDLRVTFAHPFEKVCDDAFLKAIGNPHLLSVDESSNEVLGTLRTGGVKLADGLLQVSNINRDKNSRAVKGNFTFGDGNAAYAFKVDGKTLKDLQVMEDIVIENSVPFDPDDLLDVGGYTPNSNIPTTDWASDVVDNGHDYVCFPSFGSYQWPFGQRWVKGAVPAVDGVPIVNAWDDAGGSFFKMTASRAQDAYEDWYVGDIPSFNTKLLSGIVPCLYHHQVLRACFREYGYTLTGDILDDQDYLKEYIPNQYPIIKSRFIGLEVVSPSPTVLFRRYDELTTTIEASNHLPEVSILDFIRDFMIAKNVYIDIQGSDAVIVDCRGDEAPIDMTPFLHSKMAQERVEKVAGVNLRYSFASEDEAYEKLDQWEVVVSDLPEYDTDSDTPTEPDNTLVLVKTLNHIKKTSNNELSGGDDDHFVVDNLVPYITEENAESLECVFTPMVMEKVNYTESPVNAAFLPVTRAVPYVPNTQFVSYADLGGGGVTLTVDVTDRYAQFSEEFKELPKIGIYHGLQETLSGYEFPYGSNHNYAPDDTTKLSRYHLGWHGSEGTVAEWYDNDLGRFESERKHTFKFNRQEIFNLLRWKWNRKIIVMGTLFRVIRILFPAPFHGTATFECEKQ